ncbi:MAG: phosphodiesterase [Actinomycetia bacterium]|nr:phosphodiesterase [Actinomycetes bacterium]MCP5035819.1 phosphodiesterase [Actinomycetes bacterium]
MLLAQLTDTHILDPDGDDERFVDNNQRLVQAVDGLNQEQPRPEAVIATGDMTNNGHPAELVELQRLLASLQLPLLILPGNHDNNDAFRDAFDMPWASDEHLSWVVDFDEVVLIGLDTTVVGHHHGLFDEDRQDWLAGVLAETGGRPTVVALHHPPFVSGLAAMDGTMLGRADAFAEVVAANPNVNRILCGHLHRQVIATVGGVTTSSCLSTVHHVGLNLTPNAPIELICDPAGYQLHTFDGSSWVTHQRFIDTGEAPFRPAWA